MIWFSCCNWLAVHLYVCVCVQGKVDAHMAQLKIKTGKNFAAQLQLRWRCCTQIEFSAAAYNSYMLSLSLSHSLCLSLSYSFIFLLAFCRFPFLQRFYFKLWLQSWHKIRQQLQLQLKLRERVESEERRMENSAELSWARLNWTQGRTKGGRCGNWQRQRDREGERERGWGGKREWPNETQSGRCWRADRTLLNFGSLFWPKVNYLKCFLCACSLTVHVCPRLSVFPLQDIHYRLYCKHASDTHFHG